MVQKMDVANLNASTPSLACHATMHQHSSDQASIGIFTAREEKRYIIDSDTTAPRGRVTRAGQHRDHQDSRPQESQHPR